MFIFFSQTLIMQATNMNPTRNAINKNCSGQYIQEPTDNIILFQKGIFGVSDEHLAKTLKWGPERFNIELENLVYRHITCGFSSKASLMRALSLTEDKLNEMARNAELRQLGINAMPQELSMLRAQVADLQNQMKLMQETFTPRSEPMLSRTPSHDNEPDQMTYNTGFGHPTPPCPTRFPSHTKNVQFNTNPHTYNQLYGSTISPRTFEQKNYHDSHGEWRA